MIYNGFKNNMHRRRCDCNIAIGGKICVFSIVQWNTHTTSDTCRAVAWNIRLHCHLLGFCAYKRSGNSIALINNSRSEVRSMSNNAYTMIVSPSEILAHFVVAGLIFLEDIWFVYATRTFKCRLIFSAIIVALVTLPWVSLLINSNQIPFTPLCCTKRTKERNHSCAENTENYLARTMTVLCRKRNCFSYSRVVGIRFAANLVSCLHFYVFRKRIVLITEMHLVLNLRHNGM